MMMQILHAADLPIFTDQERKPDENNKKGYFEHEAVKNTAKNKSWVKEANGKVVKVIAHLLPHLPHNFKYKIIFMERSIDDILSSQSNMLKRDGKVNVSDIYPTNLANAYKETIHHIKKWSQQQDNIDIIYLNYDEVIEDAENQIEKISKFLAKDFAKEKMISQINPELRREKSLH